VHVLITAAGKRTEHWTSLFASLCQRPDVTLTVLAADISELADRDLARHAQGSRRLRYHRVPHLLGEERTGHMASVLLLRPGSGRLLAAARRPDVVHVIGEAAYLSTWQVIRLLRRNWPGTPVTLYAAHNIVMRFPMPFSLLEQRASGAVDHTFPVTPAALKVLRAKGYRKDATIVRVLVEAMACGVPVVGSDVGEIAHVMGDAGLSFPAGDVAALPTGSLGCATIPASPAPCPSAAPRAPAGTAGTAWPSACAASGNGSPTRRGNQTRGNHPRMALPCIHRHRTVQVGGPRGDDLMSKSFNLRTALRTVRRRAGVPIIGLAIGVVAAQAVSRIMPTTYEASASMVITASDTDATTNKQTPDLALAQNLTPTVARLAGTREVASDTAATLGLPADAVQGRLSGSFEQGMQIITVKATAGSGPLAAAIANAATAAIGRQLERLEISQGADVITRPLDRAGVPGVPSSPNRQLNDALGGLVGLLAGLGLVRFSGRIDDRLRGLRRIETRLGLPILGVFPRLPRRYARHNARVLYTRSTVADAVRAVVAALTVLTAPLPRRRLLVSSVHDDDGKPLIAALLALGLADDHDRVTLIEGQLRRPAIGGHFPEAAACTVRKAIADGGGTALPGPSGLTVIVADPPPEDSDAAQPDGRDVITLLDTLADDSAVTVIHAPPVLAGGDMAALARYADGVLLVVETGLTRQVEALRAAMLVQQMGLPVVGIVVVDVAGDAADWQRPGGEAAIAPRLAPGYPARAAGADPRVPADSAQRASSGPSERTSNVLAGQVLDGSQEPRRAKHRRENVPVPDATGSRPTVSIPTGSRPTVSIPTGSRPTASRLTASRQTVFAPTASGPAVPAPAVPAPAVPAPVVLAPVVLAPTVLAPAVLAPAVAAPAVSGVGVSAQGASGSGGSGRRFFAPAGSGAATSGSDVAGPAVYGSVGLISGPVGSAFAGAAGTPSGSPVGSTGPGPLRSLAPRTSGASVASVGPVEPAGTHRAGQQTQTIARAATSARGSIEAIPRGNRPHRTITADAPGPRHGPRKTRGAKHRREDGTAGEAPRDVPARRATSAAGPQPPEAIGDLDLERGTATIAWGAAAEPSAATADRQGEPPSDPPAPGARRHGETLQPKEFA
jgi:capsular polysaccharide biosynthesis protein/Mrp family chromosome partitioning ATPase